MFDCRGGVVPPTPSVPRERGAVDKLVDFITGDGPNNRFALICPHCGTHNGLVLPQDLDRIRMSRWRMSLRLVTVESLRVRFRQ